MQGLILGIINIAIVAVIWVLVGLLIEWIARMLERPIPPEMRKFYLVLVLLIVLYMVAALLFGLPTYRII